MRRNVKHKAPYMTAGHAAEALGVSIATLYSYVSRGMLHSFSVETSLRSRRYLREDITRLIEQKDFKRNPARAAARGLHWGSPVLESALTLISEGRLFYRGEDALELAQKSKLEDVAALLWTGDSNQAGHIFNNKFRGLPPKTLVLLKAAAHLGPVERCQLVLPIAAADDLAAYDLQPSAVAKTGAQILRLLLSAILRRLPQGEIDTALAQAWLPTRRSAAPALRAALILCADHELNVSAFTARCIASARATPYEVVIGALAAFRGLQHGGVSGQVEALFEQAEQAGRLREVFAKRLRSAGSLPGFGHPLYPNGDPRAAVLISLAETYGKRSAIESARRLVRTAQSLMGQQPNLDFGLVTLTRALDLPRDSSMALFALGRSVGWIAHAIEQYADNQLIRPRARYIGPIPSG
jgi:citrate synthase